MRRPAVKEKAPEAVAAAARAAPERGIPVEKATSTAPRPTPKDLDPAVVSPRFLQSIPRDFAREHLVISQGVISQGVISEEVVSQGDGRPGCPRTTERLFVSPQTDRAVPFNIGVRLGCVVEVTLADPETIARVIDAAYGERDRGDVPGEGLEAHAAAPLEKILAEVDRDLLATQGKGPIVTLVDAILFDALARSASDVHLQPTGDHALVRYRVDGSLHTIREIPTAIALAAVSRIKVMGRMDIAERRLPQDGRATVTIGRRPIDLRISTFPTRHGERAVLRLLDNTQHLSELSALGMPGDVVERFLSCARRSNGIVLVTGPTGSGKTTTLYATLRRIASADLNVMTIEDPIEYELATAGVAISQAQVNTKKGVTFATGLRHILRQDPDVILVGEIRDLETARMAIQSSLTGHLVFSTLHTNDAPSAVTRLIDLGADPYLVSSSVSAILAQRLIRLRHEACAGGGCETCFGSGFLGRTGLFELLVVTEEVRELIARGASLTEIRAAAQRGGMRSLYDEGKRLERSGRTTAIEVERVVQELV